MGANNLIRYQTLHSDHSRFKALISICNPFDIELASNLMKDTVFEPYIASEVVPIPSHSPSRAAVISKFDIDFEALKKAVHSLKEQQKISINIKNEDLKEVVHENHHNFLGLSVMKN